MTMTQFLPLAEKASMIEAQIREYIKACDPYIFAETSTCALVLHPSEEISIAVCFGDEVIFRDTYPDVPNATILGEFTSAFGMWRNRRKLN